MAIITNILLLLAVLTIALGIRNSKVAKFRIQVIDRIKELNRQEIQECIYTHWRERHNIFHSVRYSTMLFKFWVPLKVERWYPDTLFKPQIETETQKGNHMYLLLAHIHGSWGIAGIDPHEHCAALFIEQIDKAFGEGTAYVVKLPEKDNENNMTHKNLTDLSEVLATVEAGGFDFDAALMNLDENKPKKNEH